MYSLAIKYLSNSNCNERGNWIKLWNSNIFVKPKLGMRARQIVHITVEHLRILDCFTFMLDRYKCYQTEKSFNKELIGFTFFVLK